MKRHRANVHFKGSIPAAAESATRKIIAAPIPKASKKISKKKTEESSTSSETENDEVEEIEEEVVQVTISQTKFQVYCSKKLDYFIIVKTVQLFGTIVSLICL